MENITSGLFQKDLSEQCDKEFYNSHHRRLISLKDIYERTREEICYSWRDLKNVVLNSFNKGIISNFSKVAQNIFG